MRENSVKKIIYDKICEMPYGKAFVISDFSGVAEYDTLKQNFKRLTDENKILRVLPGIYYRPKYSSLLNEYSMVSIDEVAAAIARNNNWSIVPTGETALNMLGLSTQVPSKYEFISNGPYRTYDVDGIKLNFIHRTTKQISNYSYLTALLIQAIKTVGDKNMSDKHIEILRSRLNADDKTRILEEGRATTNWIYKYIKQICSEESNEKHSITA